MVTLGAVVNLAYLAILAVFFFFQADKSLEGFTLATGILILATWALGLCWYWFWSWRAKTYRRHQHQHAHRRTAPGMIFLGVRPGG